MAGQTSGRDGLGVAVVILTVGLVASLAAWWTFRDHEQAEVQQATKRAAEAIRIDLINDLEWQVIGLDRLAMLWEAADPAQPLWTKNAELYIQHRPGCVAVEWLTPNGDKRALITAEGKEQALAFDGFPKELIAAVTRSKSAMVSVSPEKGASADRQWVIAYPVFARSQPRGYIVAFFDLEKSLNYILGDVRDLGFAFGVSLPDKPEYVLPGTNRKHEQNWGVTSDVLVRGMTWQLRVWPNAEVVNEIRSILPELILAGGCCMSLMLALSMYFAVRLAHSSDRTRRANEALQHEIKTREGAQEELRRAHADLEMRIDQRTAELASANALLRREVAEHKHTEDLLRDLTGRLFQLQDDERKRLARELHDGAAQNLVAISMDIGMIREAIPADDISNRELVNECARLIEEGTKELRTVSYLLHPPYFDELGLASALQDFVAGFATRSGIEIKLDLDSKLGRLGNQLELGIFRVIQEALSNIHRHSQSRTATIILTRNSEFVDLEITDAGRGIPPEVLNSSGSRLAGVGIAGMQERIRLLGGKLDIQSSKTGTRIHAVIALPDSNPVLSKIGVSAAIAAADAKHISAA